MPRQPRIHYEGALYHVICRGNNREWILESDEAKSKYLSLLKKYKKRYGFKLYAWVIMSNHVHLLVEVGCVPLSKIMQGIQQSYTQWYNKAHSRVGHVFAQRYKAIHCNKDSYLLNLIRYIHQNPQRAQLEEDMSYPWSGHQAYLEGNTSKLTDIEFPLSLFSTDPNKSRNIYQAFMDEEEALISSLKQGALEEGTKEQIEPVKKENVYEGSLKDIIEAACEVFKISSEALLRKNRSEQISRGRRAICLFCVDHAGFSQIDVSKALNVSQTTVTMAIKDREKLGKLEDLLVCKLIAKA